MDSLTSSAPRGSREMAGRPRSHPFRALDLPTVALEKVLDICDHFSLVYMTCCSRDASSKVRDTLSSRFASYSSINVNIENTCQTIIVEGPIGKSFTLRMLSPRHPEAANMRDVSVYNVGGVDMAITLRERTMVIVKKDFERDLVHWVEFLKDMFACKIGTISLSAKWDTDFDVLMKCPLFFKSEKLIIKPFAVRPDEMEFILENYKTDEFECVGNTKRDFRYQHPIVFNSVHFHHGSFITLENLLQMSESCEKIKIRRSRLNSEELNGWLKHWMSSTSKLQLLTIQIPFSLDGQPIATSSDILNDIPTFFMNAQRPFGDLMLARLDGFVSWDLKRADGLWATLFIKQDESVTLFELHPWSVKEVKRR